MARFAFVASEWCSANQVLCLSTRCTVCVLTPKNDLGLWYAKNQDRREVVFCRFYGQPLRAVGAIDNSKAF